MVAKKIDFIEMSERTFLGFLRIFLSSENKAHFFSVPYFVLKCSLFRSIIYIYAYTGFVGLGPNRRRPTPPGKFKKVLKKEITKNCSNYKINYFNKLNKNYFNKITNKLLQSKRSCSSKSTANAPTPKRKMRSMEMATAFATNGNSIYFF